jgi:opacity protein-like surface antigen
MKINFCGIFTLLILLIGAPSQADTLYFAAQAGVSTAPTSGNENPNDPTDNFILDTQNGVNAAVAVGAKFGMLRAEVEGVYRHSDNNKITDANGSQGAEGSRKMLNIFLNGYLEFNLLGIVSPYIGAGAGYGSVSLDVRQLDGTVIVDDKDSVYSYQLIAGAAVNLTDNFSLTADYRYFSTISDADFNISGTLDFVQNSDISTHEVRFGIRYWFF